MEDKMKLWDRIQRGMQAGFDATIDAGFESGIGSMFSDLHLKRDDR
jgi:hypothetical protein